MKLSVLAVCSIALGLCTSLSAQAQDQDDWFNDPWRAYAGAFFATVNSEIGINGDLLPPGPPIDVEDVLGVDDGKTVAWVGIGWHFAPRHAVELEYFTLERSASTSATFAPPLQVGDLFIEDGQVSTSYDTSIARLTYAFSLLRSDRSDLQLKAGLHIATLEVGLALAGSICDPTTTPSVPPGCPVANTGSEGEDVSAPLPHFGISYSYKISRNVALNLTALGFGVELDEIDGSIVEIDADIAWQPWRNFGFGIGARYFKVDVDSKGSELNGAFDFEYYGPTVYIQATF